MPVGFDIIPQRGLVFVRYTGFARLDDSFRAFAAYAAHPDFRPGQKQLVDLAGITGIENDYVRLFALQARKADVFADGGAQTLLVYHAPTPLSVRLAGMILRSWEPSAAVIPVVQQTEADALGFLGLSETSFAELLQLSR